MEKVEFSKNGFEIQRVAGTDIITLVESSTKCDSLLPVNPVASNIDVIKSTVRGENFLKAWRVVHNVLSDNTYDYTTEHDGLHIKYINNTTVVPFYVLSDADDYHEPIVEVTVNIVDTNPTFTLNLSEFDYYTPLFTFYYDKDNNSWLVRNRNLYSTGKQECETLIAAFRAWLHLTGLFTEEQLENFNLAFEPV